MTEGTILAASNPAGSIELWDVSAPKLLRSMHGHSDRIAVLDWQDFLLASGSRDGDLHLHDVRVAQHVVAEIGAHSQVKEACCNSLSMIQTNVEVMKGKSLSPMTR